MIAEEAHVNSNKLLLDMPELLPVDFDPVDLENPVENIPDNLVENLSENLVENPVVKTKESLKEKAIRRRISLKQKELMVNFIIENPELVTHSSSKESESELWNELYQKLNELKPEKSLDSWKNFLTRWRSQIFSKPEGSLLTIDYKLKKFLNKIISEDQLPNFQGSIKPTNCSKQNLGEILRKINEVEKERTNLRLEIDNYELRINKYKYIIHVLENDIRSKRAHIKKLADTKHYLYKKRRMLQTKDNYIQPEIEIKKEKESENEDENENCLELTET